MTATVGVDTRQAGPRAALAPTDQPDQQVPPVLLHRQRPTRVALAVVSVGSPGHEVVTWQPSLPASPPAQSMAELTR